MAGLDACSHKFAISPPHIVPTEECTDKAIDEGIKILFPAAPPEWALLSRFLLASLLFSREYLREKQSTNNPFSKNALFRRGIFDAIVKCTKVAFPWDEKDRDNLWEIRNFTGITAAAVGFCYHQETLQAMKNQGEGIIEGVKGMLDDRAIGGGELTVARFKEEFYTPLLKKIEEYKAQPAAPALLPDTSGANFSWSNADFRRVPKDYRLDPSLTPYQAWQFWHLGEEKGGENGFTTPPWKSLKGCDLKNHSVLKDNYVKSCLQILGVLCRSFDDAAGLTKMSKPSLQQLGALYLSESVQGQLPSNETERGRKRRNSQLSWYTSGRLIKRSRSKTTSTSYPDKKKAEKSSCQVQSKPPHTPAAATKKKCAPVKITPGDAKRPKMRVPVKVTPEGLKAGRFKRRSLHQMEVKMHGQGKAVIGEDELTTKVTSSAICFKVGGPNPGIPDLDGNFVTDNQVADLREQGLMIDGSVIMCYLNLLIQENYNTLGARREQDNFVSALTSREGDFEAYKDTGLGDAHSKMIDWDADKLIFIPIFWGAAAAGHWGLLVVDRWVHPGGVVTYFDSLPSYNPGAYAKLKKLMARSPLAMGAGADWQLGSTPKQSCGGNDCGIWMLMIATAY